MSATPARFTTLISAGELQALVAESNSPADADRESPSVAGTDAPSVVIFDCRHRIVDSDYGWSQYLAGHIPSARFAHLDRDLSSPVIRGRTGRHPLPDPVRFTGFLAANGVSNGVLVVAYDDAGGAIAARLWWMLRWLGHDAVAVLDGGIEAWVEAGGALESGDAGPVVRGSFIPSMRPGLVATYDDTLVRSRTLSSGDESAPLLDARAADRYDGTNETIDPVAGHIPGATSVPYSENLDEHRLFRSAAELRERFTSAGVPSPAKDTSPTDSAPTASSSPDAPIVYCGSGVTAAHNVLAIKHAGLGDAKLYAGSWSEWITRNDE